MDEKDEHTHLRKVPADFGLVARCNTGQVSEEDTQNSESPDQIEVVAVTAKG